VKDSEVNREFNLFISLNCNAICISFPLCRKCSLHSIRIRTAFTDSVVEECVLRIYEGAMTSYGNL
jgi:hypothetical protein